MSYEPINPNPHDFRATWVLMKGSEIVQTYETADEAYEFIYRNGGQGYHVLSPNKNRTIDPKDAKVMQKNLKLRKSTEGTVPGYRP
jgi:hypothetical protein